MLSAHDPIDDDGDEDDDETPQTSDYIRLVLEHVLLIGVVLFVLPVLWGLCCSAYGSALPQLAAQNAPHTRALWRLGMERSPWALLIGGLLWAFLRVARCVLGWFGVWELCSASALILLLAPLPLANVEQAVFYTSASMRNGTSLLFALCGSGWNRSHMFEPELHVTTRAAGYTLGVDEEYEMLFSYRVVGFGWTPDHWRMGFELSAFYLTIALALYGGVVGLLRLHNVAKQRSALRSSLRARKTQ